MEEGLLPLHSSTNRRQTDVCKVHIRSTLIVYLCFRDLGQFENEQRRHTGTSLGPPKREVASTLIGGQRSSCFHDLFRTTRPTDERGAEYATYARLLETGLENCGPKHFLSWRRSRWLLCCSKVRVGVESAEANGECLQQGHRPLHVDVEAVLAHLIIACTRQSKRRNSIESGKAIFRVAGGLWCGMDES